jgi:hypothetical protein
MLQSTMWRAPPTHTHTHTHTAFLLCVVSLSEETVNNHWLVSLMEKQNSLFKVWTECFCYVLFWCNAVHFSICCVTVMWLAWLDLGLLPCRSRFDPRPVHARFVVDRVAVGHVELWVLWFSPVSTILWVFHILMLILWNMRTLDPWQQTQVRLKHWKMRELLLVMNVTIH